MRIADERHFMQVAQQILFSDQASRRIWFILKTHTIVIYVTGWSVYADAGFPTLSLMRSPSLRHRNRRRGNRNSKNEIVSGEFDLTMDDLKCAD